MFSGIQEILVLIIIILGILFLPRILNRGGEKPSGPVKPALVLTGRMRLGIAFSVLWPLLTAAYFQPWKPRPIFKKFSLFKYGGKKLCRSVISRLRPFLCSALYADIGAKFWSIFFEVVL